jgi:hypothetical protein
MLISPCGAEAAARGSCSEANAGIEEGGVTAAIRGDLLAIAATAQKSAHAIITRMPFGMFFIVPRFNRTIREESKPADDIEAWRAQQQRIRCRGESSVRPAGTKK